MWECRSRSWQTEVLSCNQILKELVEVDQWHNEYFEWNFHVKKNIVLTLYFIWKPDIGLIQMFVGFVFFHHLFDSIQFHKVNVRLDDVSIDSFARLQTIFIFCFYFGDTIEILNHTQSKLKKNSIQIFVWKILLYFLHLFSL